MHQLDQYGIDKAVLVQYRADLPLPGNTNNAYHVQCLTQYPSRLASVGIVDWAQKDALTTLESWFQQGIQGLRLDGDARSPGSDQYAIWKKAAELEMNVSVYNRLERIPEIVKHCPDLRIHIEHCGQPALNGEKILELARYSSVYVKFSVGGLASYSKHDYPYTDVQPFIKQLIHQFGANRIMYSSDYPASGRIIGYGKVLQYLLREVSILSWEDKEWIMGKTALSMWKFQENTTVQLKD
jgi:predicted TIM-barrel fold metal-dependent hydrolase